MDATQFATKQDLKELKTELKTDTKGLKTDVKDIKSDIKILRGDILKVEERVENIEEDVKDIKVILGRMENTLDGFVGRVDDMTVDNEVGTHQTHDLQLKVNDHEKRLKQIESPKQTT